MKAVRWNYHTEIGHVWTLSTHILYIYTWQNWMSSVALIPLISVFIHLYISINLQPNIITLIFYIIFSSVVQWIICSSHRSAIDFWPPRVLQHTIIIYFQYTRVYIFLFEYKVYGHAICRYIYSENGSSISNFEFKSVKLWTIVDFVKFAVWTPSSHSLNR